MTDELEKKLIERFPAFFRDVDAPMTQTCMCWGCDCGDGWFQILWDMCLEIEKELEKEPLRALKGEFKFSQIKEKFATLRVYCWAATDEIYSIISKAEGKSARTCEECGKPGKCVGKSWVKTLCEECNKKRGRNF